MDMRGLKNFITEIREVADNREAEVKRVELELSKIRAKFKQSSSLSAYDRKKYVCKLLFIFMLGYQVEFGHMECVQLLSGDSASEKLIGYLAMSVLLHEGHELLTLTVHTVSVDLAKGDELRKCLALTALANVGSRDFAEAMGQHVSTIVTNRAMPSLVRKKAFLAALRIHRRFKGIIDPAVVGPTVADAIASADFSLATAACTFALGLLQDSENLQHLRNAPGAAIKALDRIILERASPAEYIHCGVPSPWLQGKLVRLLQEFPPPESVQDQETISGILARIVRATTRTIQEAQTSSASRHDPLLIRCNCMVSVLAEIISLVIQWNVSSQLLTYCRDALGLLLNDRKDANRRYVGLTLLTRMSFCSAFVDAQTDGQADGTATFASQIAKYQPIIVAVLHDADDSLRKRALDLLYAMCDAGNAAQVVGELLEYLPHADVKFREYLVLMIAILAEKFCGDITWYVDVLVAVIEQGGEVITEDVWQRLVHIAVNAPNVQTHAVDTVFRALARTQVVNEPLIRVAAILLGEFGYQIALMSGSTPAEQLSMLHSKLAVVSDSVKAMLLSTFVKFYNLYDNPSVRERIKKIVGGLRTSFDPELQQRATEYYLLITAASDDALQAALEPLPPFELQASTMTERLRLKQRGESKDLWAEKRRERDAVHLRQSAVLRQAAAKGAEETHAEAAAAAAATATAEAAQKLTRAAAHHDPTSAAMAAVRDGAALAAKLAASRSSAADGSTAKPAAAVPAAGATAAAAAAPAAAGGSAVLQASTSSSAAPHRESSDILGPEAGAAKGKDLDDIFGGGPSAPPATTSAASGTSADQVARWAFGARLEPAGSVLYEDKFVRISCRYEVRGADARATVTIANRNPGATLEGLGIRIQSTPASLMVQMQPLQTTTLAPDASVDVQFASRSLGVFDQSATLGVSGMFADARMSLTLPLPFYATTFLEPYKLENTAKYEALWGNTRGGAAGSAHSTAHDVAMASSVLDPCHGDTIAAAERAMFKFLKLFTLKPGNGKIYGIAAHAYMPAGQTQYNPVMVTVTTSGGGGAAGGAAASDDPFGFSAPSTAAAGSSGATTVTVETKCPDGAIQEAVHKLCCAVLRGVDQL